MNYGVELKEGWFFFFFCNFTVFCFNFSAIARCLVIELIFNFDSLRFFCIKIACCCYIIYHVDRFYVDQPNLEFKC